MTDKLDPGKLAEAAHKEFRAEITAFLAHGMGGMNFRQKAGLMMVIMTCGHHPASAYLKLASLALLILGVYWFMKEATNDRD